MEGWVSATAHPDIPSHLGGECTGVYHSALHRGNKAQSYTFKHFPLWWNTAATLVTGLLPQLNGSTPFVHHGQNDQVNASRQLHSETHWDVLVLTPNANQLQWKFSPHVLCLAFSQLFLTGNTSMLIRHHKCIKCNKDVYIKQQTTH